MASRRRHFAAERLSKAGQAVVRRGYDNNWTLAHTVETLRKTTGEELNESSLHRYWSSLRVQQRLARRQQAADAALAMVSSDPDGRMARAISLRLQERLLEMEDDLAEGDPQELLRLHVAMERMAVAVRHSEVRSREADAEELKAQAAMIHAEAARTVAEARLEQVRLTAQQAAQELEKASKGAEGGPVSADAVERATRLMYGIAAPNQEEQRHG